MDILDKAQCMDLLFRGALGNIPKTWQNLNDVLRSNYDGNLVFRCIGKFGGGECAYMCHKKVLKICLKNG